MLAPALALIGFLLLIALVVALGMRSTNLYERAQQERTNAAPSAARSVAARAPEW
jgi:type II secretory pathway pseudopilin PulG